jgi:hypothetical protein
MSEANEAKTGEKRSFSTLGKRLGSPSAGAVEARLDSGSSCVQAIRNYAAQCESEMEQWQSQDIRWRISVRAPAWGAKDDVPPEE